MRQAVITEPGRIEITEVAPPRPGPRDALVATSVVGICGSDLHALQGRHPWISLPVAPGHEVAGTVEAVGDEVEGLVPGDRVLLEANLVCRTCLYCRSGRYNLCERLKVVGCQTAGAMGDGFVVDADRLHPVPEMMSMDDAALVEPLATATHAIRVAGGVEGAVVAVLGAGSIGLLTMLAARASGAARVAVTDPVATKRERALRLGAGAALDPGAETVVDDLRSGFEHRPDVVFDCVATQSSIDQAVALALKGGTVIVIGVPQSAVSVELPLLQDREIRIQGAAMYVLEDVKRALELVSDGRVRRDDVVTAKFPLSQAAAAFAAAASGDEVKVHLVP